MAASSSTPKSPAPESETNVVNLPYGIAKFMKTARFMKTAMKAAPSLQRSPRPDNPVLKTSSCKALGWLALGMMAAAASVLIPDTVPLFAEMAVRTLVQKVLAKKEKKEDNYRRRSLVGSFERRLVPVPRVSRSEIKWASKERLIVAEGLLAFISEIPNSPTPMRSIIIMDHRVLAERAFIAGFLKKDLQMQLAAPGNLPVKWSPAEEATLEYGSATPMGKSLNPNAIPFKAAEAAIKKSLNPTATPFVSLSRSDSDCSLDTKEPIPSSPQEQYIRRIQYLENVLVGFETYQPTNLLPEGVNLALMKTRQERSPRIAVDLEILLVKGMISTIEFGQSTSSIDWAAWWVDVNDTLYHKYIALAEKFIILANSL